MPQTPNHGYNVPNKGDPDWHVPLNENFEDYDTDIEIRDTDGNKGNYQPKAGAKFLATDTETVYVGDGSNWNELASTGREPEVDTLTSTATIDVAGVDAEGGTVKAGIVSAKGILAEGGLTTPAINANSDALGVGTDTPSTPLDVRGQNNWNLDNSDGDVRIGDDNYRLAIGVALGGGGAGNAAIRAKGGDALKLGAGGSRGLTVKSRYTSFPAIRIEGASGLFWEDSSQTSNNFLYDPSSGVFQFFGENAELLHLDPSVSALRSGLNVNGDLDVDGNKNFVQSVDTDHGEKEVVYTATEAPTPRTEASGVGSLEDGRAEVELPEHFGWVTDDAEALIVETTPYSADSGGLAVVERSTDHLVVADLDGEGDYEFAYTVRGTRDGHADKQVVREPGADSPATDGTPTLADD